MVKSMFKSKIQKISEKNKSRIVLALDLIEKRKEKLLKRSFDLIERLSSLICAVKINRHLVLPLGLSDGVKKIVKFIHSFDLPVIIDCKINDIGSTNFVIAKNYFNAGFDALTANPLVGLDDGLKPVLNLAHNKGKGVITVVYMSHKGAEEFYEKKILEKDKLKPQYIAFAEKSLEWNVDGVIVGATRPEKIGEIKRILKEKIPIYSPGIGFQGGKIEEAVKMGSDFLIVGRTIINAKDPVREAEKIRKTLLKL